MEYWNNIFTRFSLLQHPSTPILPVLLACSNRDLLSETKHVYWFQYAVCVSFSILSSVTLPRITR